MPDHDTIIIGGGISGLACAKTLTEADREFLLITKELGGRMRTSKSLTVDYGASYLTSDYKHVLQVVDKGDPLPLRDHHFIQGDTIGNIFLPRNLIHLPKFLKVCFLVDDFARRIARFRKRSLIMGQKRALQEDATLVRYTRQSAEDFVKVQGITYLHDTFFHPVLQSTAFVTADRCNAFYYLAVLIPIVRKTYAADFRHTAARFSRYLKNVAYESVVSVKKRPEGTYAVKTNRRQYTAKQVVIAVPYLQAKKFYPVKHAGSTIPIYVIHVIGKREEAYDDKKVVFFTPKHHDITILWKQPSGSDIIFSKYPHPNLEKYYEYHQVVKTTYWANAIARSGAVEHWVDQKLADGLYLASDYNICGLEDAYLTGVYAANRIIVRHE